MTWVWAGVIRFLEANVSFLLEAGRPTNSLGALITKSISFLGFSFLFWSLTRFSGPPSRLLSGEFIGSQCLFSVNSKSSLQFKQT